MRLRRDSLIPLGLAVACFATALLQRPGLIVAETKIDLFVSPVSFLSDVLSAWTPSTSFGHVWAGQYGGYLWPMAPFFALGHTLGIPTWIVGRLWLGTLMALAAWGMVRLLDALAGRPRGMAQIAGGLLYAFNPYVVTYAGRTSITLIAYAALPWLLLCVHRGVRDPRGWWWPVGFALILTSTGGGVNVAVTAWLLLGPALLLAYERGIGDIAWSAIGRFLLRTAAVGLVTSLWWLAAVLVHVAYAQDFLPFTEQPGTIWSTTSISETLRGLGFWTSYIGQGYTGVQRSFQADAGVYLRLVPVILATFAVPALSLMSFAWTRRVRYASFFLALVLLAVLVMAVGFPEGTPLRSGATFTYNHVASVRFLRTTYKAGSLLALGMAGLGGLGAAWAWARVRSAPGRAALAAGALALVALTVWPFVRGVGLDRQLGFRHVPAAWTDVARDLDRTLPQNARAMVLPGSLFGAYTWGGTYDPILPALTDRPVAERVIVPFSDLRAYDLQQTTDALVGQARALPGQLPALLDLEGVGAIVSAADEDRSRSGGGSAADAATVLARQGYGRPARSYGPLLSVPPGEGTIAPVARLPQVRRYAVRTHGIVRVLPRAPQTIVDGSAQAVVDLAGFAALPRARVLRYAADLTPAALRAQATAGADVVISDSNRRRIFVAARRRGNTGYTLGPGDKISEDAAQLNPFAARGNDAQTIALLGGGLRAVTAPYSPGFAQFPERRPFAALDGDPRTAWVADRALAVARRRLQVDFDRPRDVPYVDLLPYADSRGVPDRISVNGRAFAVRRGWNRLRLGLRRVPGLVVVIDHVRLPPLGKGGAGGIRELRIPGVHPTETLRTPLLAEDALRGADLARTSLSYLLDRTTGDDPSRPRVVVAERQRGFVRDQEDGELGWRRSIDPPAPRSWGQQAWTRVAPRTSDSAIDTLVGATGAARFDSSSRFEGRPRNRASSAFDGLARRGWIGGWIRGRSAWLQWRTAAVTTLRELTLVPLPLRVRRPRRVRLIADGRAGPALSVGTDGRVVLPAPVRARTFRLRVLDASFPAGTPALARRRRAVGVGEVRGTGIPRAHVPRRGALRVACAAGPRLALGARTAQLRPGGSIAELDAGRPLRARGCAPVALPAARTLVVAPAGPWLLDHVRLTAPAPAG
ncbi:MAG TPA: alpha-(1-_3)-arabinofuranosyltransferase family protein, partial [Solirubrobacteraceae bacterium]